MRDGAPGCATVVQTRPPHAAHTEPPRMNGASSDTVTATARAWGQLSRNRTPKGTSQGTPHHWEPW